MPVIVQKYGGSSVANEEKIRQVAKRVGQRKSEGYDVVVVVSAMGDTTDHLLSLARRVSRDPHKRELDMLVTAGERISIALLSMALWDLGFEAISFTGSQSGIITNDSHNKARVVEVRPYRIQDELERGRIVIVAGYQGVSYRREITSLGRGGTDTTAVAMAAALGAEVCEIYSDVDGIYSADPGVVLDAERLSEISAEEMLTLAKHGARVLNSDAVAYAKNHGIALFAKASFGPKDDSGTVVRVDPPKDSHRISGVTSRTDAHWCKICWDAESNIPPTALIAALGSEGITPDHVLAMDHELNMLLYEENHPSLSQQVSETSLPHGARWTEHRQVCSATMVGYALCGDPGLCAEAIEIVEEGWTPLGVLVEPLALTFILDQSVGSMPDKSGTGSQLDALVRKLHSRFVLGTA